MNRAPIVLPWLLLGCPAAPQDPSHEAPNQAPVLTLAEAGTVPAGQPRRLALSAQDPDGDTVTLAAGAERGAAWIEAGELVYLAPEEAGEDTVRLFADDGAGHYVSAEQPVQVSDPLDFGAPEDVAITEGNAKVPVAAWFQDQLHVVWHDFSLDPAGLGAGHGSSGDWTWDWLDLAEGEKAIRPQLLADGESLHLVFEQVVDDVYWLWHSTWAGGWAAPVLIGEGRRASLAVGPDGTLHLVAYGGDDLPVHHRWDGAWTPGDPIVSDAPYVYSLGLVVLGGSEGLRLGQLLSPGETSYDFNLMAWTHDGGWAPPEILVQSMFLGGEEPRGATGPDGTQHWVWSEQDPDDLWTFGIAEATVADAGAFRWATRVSGFSGNPAVVVPPDGRPVVAWITERGELQLSRAPYEESVQLDTGSRNPALAVDDEGFVHVVWAAADADSVEQVRWVSNRVE